MKQNDGQSQNPFIAIQSAIKENSDDPIQLNFTSVLQQNFDPSGHDSRAAIAQGIPPFLRCHATEGWGTGSHSAKNPKVAQTVASTIGCSNHKYKQPK